MPESAKKKAAAEIREAHEIARRLYLRDKARYEQIFGGIGEHVKRRRSLELVVKALKRVEEMEIGGDPPQGPIPYLGGVLRKLEEEEEATKIRQSGATIGEMLGPVVEKMRGKEENS